MVNKLGQPGNLVTQRHSTEAFYFVQCGRVKRGNDAQPQVVSLAGRTDRSSCREVAELVACDLKN